MILVPLMIDSPQSEEVRHIETELISTNVAITALRQSCQNSLMIWNPWQPACRGVENTIIKARTMLTARPVTDSEKPTK